MVLALVAGIVLFLVLQKTLPDTNKQMALEGLGAPVEVVFDAESVPHVIAETYNDAARALGALHARDRLWQMEVLRMAGQGRLSEMFGEATLGTDRFLRTLGMAEAARTSYEKLLPETQAALQAYVAGVNTYIARETDLLEPALGAEFLILGHSPEEWEAWQSVLVIKVMGLTLGKNIDNEIKRLKLARNGFSSSEIDEMVPYGPRDNPPVLPNLLEIYGLEPLVIEPQNTSKSIKDKQFDFALRLDWPIGISASNNWVISGARTDTGQPILANDPHLGFTAPSTFYLAHLSWKEDGETRDTIGGTIPGVPFVIVGRTNNVAWGLTTTNHDAQDLYLEKLDDAGEKFLTPNGWQPISTRETELKFGGEAPEKLTIRSTRNGPILPRSYKSIGEFLPEDYGLALRWTGVADDDTTLDTLFLNNRAQSVAEFLEGSKRTVSPMQSIVIADTAGNIALAAHARSPIRKFSNRIAGRAPVPGWDDTFQWNGFLEHENLFTRVNPSENALTTANGNFLPEDYVEHITFDWAEQFRQQRAEDLVLGRSEAHTMQTSVDIMGDTVSPAMLKLRDLSQRLVRDAVGERGDIQDALAAWDGRMAADRSEPLIMISWFRHLNIAMLQDDLGKVFPEFKRGRLTRLIGMLERGNSRDWCDNRGTPATETCADTLEAALDAAIAELKRDFGENWREWKYGNAHTAYSEHRPFGQVAPLADYFNIEVPSSGGPYTLLRGQTDFGLEKPYRSRHGAAYRAVYDLSDLDKSIYIQSTGQSGNFLSPDYDNFSQRWSNIEFIPMSTQPDDFRANAKGIWKFEP